MRLLIAVKSCRYDQGRGTHELVRNTWGKDVIDADLRFFMGMNGANKFDEENVDAPDNYPGLPLKTREISRYAIRNGYDFAFLCDTGSFVIPHHLMNSGFEQNDYTGYWGMRMKTFPYIAEDGARGCPPVTIPVCHPWASGGGYVLSQRAMQLVAQSTPDVHAEDLWVGQVLGRAGVVLHDGATEGWKGRVVNWIHRENNEHSAAMERRTKWMTNEYEKSKEVCKTEGCSGPYWQSKGQMIRDLSDPVDVEQILKMRRKERHETRR
jgi:hypothetical protein